MSSGATVVLSSRPAAPLSPYRYPLRLPSMSSSRTGSGSLVSRETGPGACPSAVEGRGHSPVVVDYRIQNRSGGFTRTSPDVPPSGPVSASHAGRRCLGRHRILSVSRETYRMFSSALTPVTVLLRLLHRWSDLSRTHVLHTFTHPTSFRCMINAVITSGSEHFISDERSSQSPSCAGEGGAIALVSRETNRQPCRRETLKCARYTCSFPRTPTCFLREQRSSWATGTGTTVMHCGRHPYVRRTLRVQKSMKQRRAEKYRKSFVRTPIPPERPRRRRCLRSGEAVTYHHSVGTVGYRIPCFT